MKIARIETFILGTGSAKDLLFCRVETEDGLYGWGEAYVTQGKEKVVAECIQAMAPHVIGRSAFNIRHTGQVMYEDFAIKRGSPELLSAWSAVEIASWELDDECGGVLEWCVGQCAQCRAYGSFIRSRRSLDRDDTRRRCRASVDELRRDFSTTLYAHQHDERPTELREFSPRRIVIVDARMASHDGEHRGVAAIGQGHSGGGGSGQH